MKLPVYPTIPTAHTIQEFGNVDWSMYSKTEGKHMGIDIGVTSGLPGADIYAVYHGMVVEVGYKVQGGYGKRVRIEHENGQYSTLYAHLHSIDVVEGAEVLAGQKIGTMGGNTDDPQRGTSSGTHLHFEVILQIPVANSIRTSLGYTVDPFAYLLGRYFLAPVGYGEVVSPDGVKIRSTPDATSNKNKIGVVYFRNPVTLMAVDPPTGVGDQWARLWALREEWVAIRYKSQQLIRLTTPPVVVEPPDDPHADPTGQFEAGYNAALDDMAAHIASLRKIKA